MKKAPNTNDSCAHMAQEGKDAVDLMVEQWHRERPDLGEKVHLMELLVRTTRMQRTLDSHMKRLRDSFGLTSGEIDMLFTLRRSGAPYTLTAGCFVKRVMITPSAITNRLDNLESKKLIKRTRHAKDRRTVYISLTPKGIKLADALVEAHLADYEQLFSHLTPEQYETVNNALRTLLIEAGDTSLA